MADVTEKQRLLREMKLLSDLLNKVKQRYDDHAGGTFGTETLSTAKYRQQLDAQHQQASSSIVPGIKPDSSIAPGTKPDNSVVSGTKPGSSVTSGSGAKPGSSVQTGTNPGSCVQTGTKPGSCVQIGTKPGSCVQTFTKPGSSVLTDNGTKPNNSVQTGTKPGSCVQTGTKPGNCVQTGTKPGSSVLTDNGTKPYNSVQTGTKPGSIVVTGDGTKPNNSVQIGTKAVNIVVTSVDPLSTCLPHYTSATCVQADAKVKHAYKSSAGATPIVTASHIGLLTSTQQQAKVLSQRDSSSGNDVHLPCTGAQQLEDPKTVVFRRIVAASWNPRPSLDAGKGIVSAVQTGSSGKSGLSVNESTGMPTQQASCKATFYESHSLTCKAQTSQGQKHLVAHRTAQGLSGQKSSADLVCSEQQVSDKKRSITKSLKSSREGEVISRNAQVIAARKMMQSELENLKSKLAKLEAAKERKKCEVRSQDDTSEKIVVSMRVETVLKENRPCASGCQEGSQRQIVTYSTSDSDADIQAPHMQTECSDNFKATSRPVPYLSNKPQHCTAMQRSSASEPSLSSPVTNIRMEKMASPRISDKSPCSSPSTAKANLEKELKAAEEKFQDMRRKIGVMLKESPQKSNTHMVSKRQLHQHPKKGVSIIADTVHTYSTPVSLFPAKQTLFPAGTSLKQTQKNLPKLKLVEEALVVGNSPSLRSFNMVTVKDTLSNHKLLSHGRKCSTPMSSRTRKQTPKGRKAQYSLVRTAPTQASVSVVQAQGDSQVTGSKSFVSRYKVRKISNRPKVCNVGVTVSKKTVVHSPYKLTKFGSKDSLLSPACTSGLSTPLTAKQKAAQIIKSKYKMRKLPLSSSPFHNVVQTRRNQHFNPYYQTVNTSAFNSCDNAWKLKVSRQTSLSSPISPYRHLPSFFPMAAARGRRRGRRNGQTVRFPQGPWRGAFHSYPSSLAWWMQNQRQMGMQRARAARGAIQWKTRTQWEQPPYLYHLKNRMCQLKKQQLQERLHLKRQQWKKMNSLRNQMYRQHSHLMKTGTANPRREHLVMINGGVYKSTSRQLTRTSPSNPSTKCASFNSKINICVCNNSSRNKMRMLTVRGAWFKMDARGTKLQRVASSRRGKTTCVTCGGTGPTTRDGLLENMLKTRNILNRIKQRSMYLAAVRSKKENTKNVKKNCLYFSRFGKCSRGEKCPFLHDPSKIAVCTRMETTSDLHSRYLMEVVLYRMETTSDFVQSALGSEADGFVQDGDYLFLRGTCRVQNCPFSHNLSKEKMPVCTYFLKGVCTRDPCPYLHVKVNQGAQVCQDFLSGFCRLAEMCPKLHTLTCPQFAKTGVCADGNKCRMMHRRGKAQNTHGVTSSTASTNSNSPHGGIKRCSRPEATEKSEATGDEDSSGSRPKRVRPDISGSPARSAFECNSPSSTSSTAVTAEGMVPSPGSLKVLEAEELGEEEPSGAPSSQRLTKLPAFISLADYSFEESPIRRVTSLVSRKPLMQNKESTMKIKPHL